MGFIHKRDYYHSGDIIVLDCDTQCNFMVMSDTNFSAYRNLGSFKYHGGFYKYFPARIAIPSDGYWNIVIDVGGGQANIRYSLSVVNRR